MGDKGEREGEGEKERGREGERGREEEKRKEWGKERRKGEVGTNLSSVGSRTSLNSTPM